MYILKWHVPENEHGVDKGAVGRDVFIKIVRDIVC